MVFLLVEIVLIDFLLLFFVIEWLLFFLVGGRLICTYLLSDLKAFINLVMSLLVL